MHYAVGLCLDSFFFFFIYMHVQFVIFDSVTLQGAASFTKWLLHTHTTFGNGSRSDFSTAEERGLWSSLG